jgi:penicillin-binding protein 1A
MRRHWRLVVTGGGLMTGLATLDVWLFTCGFEGCPTAQEIRTYQPPEGGRVFDRNGRSMGRLNLVRRINVPLAGVPPHVQRAFIATEDRRFHEHRGLDWRAVGRAVVRNASSLGVREGFSTITMQVARNTFLAHRVTSDRTLGRKLLELRVARLLERNLSKERILEIYLNAIYLGNGVYGVEAASRDLFGKRVRDLTVAQGAMLAALPKGPSVYTPRRDQGRALARRNLVLSLMEREGFLSTAAAARARGERLTVARTGWRPAPPNASYAMDLVRALVDSVLRAAGTPNAEVAVHTTLDPTAQRAAERAVREGAADADRMASDWWYPGEEDGRTPPVEGAMVALDPRTGDIRALVGGRRYVRGAFNRAVGARRQPGSAFKPFVYAAALSVGFTPATLVDDSPVAIDQGNGDLWTPTNYGDEYAGTLTMRGALARSANAATVRISRAVGEQRVVETAQRNGIASPIKVVPAVALGALEVTPMELVAAYAPFANGGSRVRPRLVRRIERADGTVLWSSEVESVPVMDPRDAFQLTSMLRGAVDDGTGRVLRDMGVSGPVAGKTGTTNDGADVWFVGYTPTLVAGFWFGRDAPRSLGPGATGGRFAAPAWARFYRSGWRERGESWEAPDGLVAREIDPETGALANEWCPLRAREWFRIGTEPAEECRVHDAPLFQHWLDGLDEEISERVSRALRRIFRRGR